MLKIVKKTEATIKQKIAINIVGIFCCADSCRIVSGFFGISSAAGVYLHGGRRAGSSYRISQTVIQAVPLIILSLALPLHSV